MIYRFILKISRSFFNRKIMPFGLVIFLVILVSGHFIISATVKILKWKFVNWLQIFDCQCMAKNGRGHTCFIMISLVHDELMTWTQGLLTILGHLKRNGYIFYLSYLGLSFVSYSLYHHFLWFLSTSLRTLYSKKNHLTLSFYWYLL